MRVFLLTLVGAVFIGEASADVILYQNTFPGQPNGGDFGVRLAEVDGYSTFLGDNTSTISFGFNVTFDSRWNAVELFINENRDRPFELFPPPTKGYRLSIGTLVGPNTPTALYHYIQGTPTVQQPVRVIRSDGVSISSTGTVRLDYDPGDSRWDLYLENSPTFLDPLSLTSSSFRGSVIDSTYTDIALPYLFVRTSGVDGSYTIDNFVISASIPEPSQCGFLLSAAAFLICSRRRTPASARNGTIC